MQRLTILLEDVVFSRRTRLECPTTKLTAQAMTNIQALPPEMQDEIARMVLTYAGDDRSLVDLTSAEEAALDQSEIAASRGEFATEEEVRATWAKHGL